QQLQAAVVLQTGTSRNEPAHDDVFFQAAQVIDFSGNRSLGKDARRFLEACSGDEGVGRERRLGDTKEQRTTGCRTATFANDPVVLLAEAELVHLLFEEER